MANHIQKFVQGMVKRSKQILASPRTPNPAFLSRSYSIYEPDDLNLEPDIPEHETLNIRLNGYDYVVLESFTKYVHNLVKGMELDCSLYPVPARTSHIKTYKPFSTNILSEYDLAVYERTLQVEDLPSTHAPILVEAIQQNLPEGVSLTIKEPVTEEEEFKYVPDVMLMDLQSQVAEMDRAREEKRKK